MRPTYSILTLSLFVAASLSAQKPGAHWALTNVSTTNVPPPRHENPGAASKTHFYVFGGNSNANSRVFFNDLWSFDGKAWKLETKDKAAGSPSPRHQAAICWDEARNKLMVFGGHDGSKKLNDLWQWDPTTKLWKDVTPKSPLLSPSPRQFASMAFDPSSGTITLFGGLSAKGHENDTWQFLGGAIWRKSNPTTSPPARRQHHMATRFGFGDIVMCGGQNLVPSKVQFKDVWRFKSGQWTLIKPTTTTRPTTVVANNAFYDEKRQRLNLSGGNFFGGAQAKVVQEFDCVANKWVARGVDNVFLKCTRYFAGYIRNLGKTYKISGQNALPLRTYVYESEKPPKSVTGSAGCSINASTPTPNLRNDPAWLDRPLVVEMEKTPKGAVTLVLVGAAPAIKLPLSALGIGPARCVLTVNPLLVLPAVPNKAGNAEMRLPLPNTPTLAGVSLMTQALFAFQSTFYVSNRLDVTLGAL